MFNSRMKNVSLLALILTGTVCTFSTPAMSAIGIQEGTKSSVIHLGAEKGELTGTQLMRTGAGSTNPGFITGFDADGDTVRWHIPSAKAGIYQVRVRYRAPQEKGFDLVVNGAKASAMFPPSKGSDFATYDAGKVELLDGANTFAIEKGWGHYDIDSVDLTLAPPAPPLQKIKPELVDKKATPKARALMQYLASGYGNRTLSGQQNISDVDYVRETTGKTPAILSWDLIEYSPSRVEHGSKPEGGTERAIAQYRSGQLLSVMWHWNAPKNLIDQKDYIGKNGKPVDASWYRGFYTEATTFDLNKALADPKSADYQLLLRDIDTIAVQLKKIQAAGVPILWRPLHEAEGGWFWWGAKGPEPFKKLWRLMYTRLTVKHGLHNLIWVYTAGGKKEWYPGDDVVDIVGADAYPTDVRDPLSNTWEDLFHQYDGHKMLALSEFGGVPDVDRMARYGVHWVYFASWGDKLGPKKVTSEELKRLYSEKRMVNKDALPKPLTGKN